MTMENFTKAKDLECGHISSVAQMTTKRMESLLSIWEELGIPCHQIEKRCSAVFVHVDNLLQDMIKEETSLLQQTKDAIDQCEKEIICMRKQLDLSQKEDDFKNEPDEKYDSLLAKKNKLERTRTHLSKVILKRKTKMYSLVEKETKLSSFLGVSPHNLILQYKPEMIPSREDIETLILHVKSLRSEERRRLKEFKERRKRIEKLLQDHAMFQDDDFAFNFISQEDEIPTTMEQEILDKLEEIENRLMVDKEKRKNITTDICKQLNSPDKGGNYETSRNLVSNDTKSNNVLQKGFDQAEKSDNINLSGELKSRKYRCQNSQNVAKTYRNWTNVHTNLQQMPENKSGRKQDDHTRDLSKTDRAMRKNVKKYRSKNQDPHSEEVSVNEVILGTEDKFDNQLPCCCRQISKRMSLESMNSEISKISSNAHSTKVQGVTTSSGRNQRRRSKSEYGVTCSNVKNTIGLERKRLVPFRFGISGSEAVWNTSSRDFLSPSTARQSKFHSAIRGLQ